MDIKNKIKIDSFEITEVKILDIPDVLKLAISNQNSFKISSIENPSVFITEMIQIIQNNMNFSFVFRDNDHIFGAFIVKPLTSTSAEILYAFSDQKVIQTEKMYEGFSNRLKQMKFDSFYVSILKKRKKFQAYVRFLNLFGFKKIHNENDTYLTLVYEK